MATDLFTGTKHAELYAKFRPIPPKSCTDYIISYLNKKIQPPFKKAIDVGCGSGQSTKILSPYFEEVWGLDVSEAQIECAQKVHSAPNIQYNVARGEKLPVDSSSVQLVTFCESFHWFNFDEIFPEIERVLVPNGVIAVYGHWLPVPKFDDEVKSSESKKLILEYLVDSIDPFWDKEVAMVKDHYKNIILPFQDNQRMDFVKEVESDLASYIGYISTWSSYQKFLKEDSEKATQLLQEVKNKLISIVEEDKPPEDITFTLVSDYFLVIGHK